MAELDGNDVVAIKKLPLQIDLQRRQLQTALEATTAGSQRKNDPSEDGHESDSIEVDDIPDLKDAISGLLGALVFHPVAKKLRSRVSRGTLFGDLATLIDRFDSDEINTTTFQPLIHTVVQQKSDTEIWKQVLILIISSRITPPTTASPSFGGTPRTHSSASHQGSEQTKSLLYDALRDELCNSSYVKVEGFFEKYFDEKSWTPKSRDIFRAAQGTHLNGRWTTFPSRPTENAVWDWWSQFQAEHLTDLPGVYHRTLNKTEMVDADGERQLDLFVKSSQALLSGRHLWDDVRVIGEHTESKNSGKKFLQLARYARNVFSAQPRRQFVHAFILFYTKMELHVFDRSGTFSMEPFDIHEQPERFIRVISGYCMMSDEELGLDNFIERKGQDEYVSVNDQEGKEKRLQLISLPIARRRAIVGRSTSCYCTADGQSVVKFSWISAMKSPTEPELLTLANERQVKGVPRLIGYREVVSTGKLRSLLAFSKRRHIEGRQYSLQEKQSDVSFSSQFASLPLSEEGKKRKWAEPDQSFSKKSRLNSETSKLSQVYEAGSKSQLARSSQMGDEPFIDRILCVQATQPAGRALAQFHSARELLQAIRDAIKVHRSLFLDGKILHRDISECNIIITNPDENEGRFGMLIDVELGTVVEDGKNTRTGLQRMTGTIKYMAIQVLRLGLSGARSDLDHTYRHDLESFFYVFLSFCVSHGWEEGKAPKEDPLREWYVPGDYDAMVRAKLGDMEPNGFETLILPKFSPTFECVKDLATSLRDILFLCINKLRIGTPAGAPSTLYDQMIGAFDKAIESC